VRVPPPGLRVLANSDSNMQRFESRVALEGGAT
jgi:hypothetical protein